MICGDFSECMAPRLELEDVAAGAYSDVMDLWCGKDSLGDKPLCDVMTMASVADRLGMTEVGTVLEDAIIGQLSVDVCGDVLIGSVGLGRVGWRWSGSRTWPSRRGSCGWTRGRWGAFWTTMGCV